MPKALKSGSPLLIDEPGLSRAWSRVLLHILDRPGTEVSPLVVSITGFSPDGEPNEHAGLRTAIDATLAASGAWPVEIVAFTIFPLRLWQYAEGDRAKFFALYRRAFPKYQAMNRVANGRGLYFGRLSMQGPATHSNNQLEFIISQYLKRPQYRRSMFQASVFDPSRDHVPQAQLGFPCLQHVSFVPVDGEALVMNAFYATQQLFERAYGNYLGLSRLGAFMASQMQLRLERLNVFVGIAKLEGITKADAGSLRPEAERCLRSDA